MTDLERLIQLAEKLEWRSRVKAQLTDERIEELAEAFADDDHNLHPTWADVHRFARAIEREIKGETA